jgi:endonuclease V-like protein UPF0215 family
VKSGIRALGIAESAGAGAETSTLAGAVVRADRTVDGFGLNTCTVGGMDVTEAIGDLYDGLNREDIRYVIVAGVALAWYNLLDMRALYDRIDRPVLSISFEESPGLTGAIREDVANPQPRLNVYNSLPERHAVEVNGEPRFVRAVGCDAETAAEVVRGFTPHGGRPEPVRVGRLLARAADEWARDGHPKALGTE